MSVCLSDCFAGDFSFHSLTPTTVNSFDGCTRGKTGSLVFSSKAKTSIIASFHADIQTTTSRPNPKTSENYGDLSEATLSAFTEPEI